MGTYAGKTMQCSSFGHLCFHAAETFVLSEVRYLNQAYRSWTLSISLS